MTIHKDETEMFEGVASWDKDPRKSIHVEDVPLPELGLPPAHPAPTLSTTPERSDPIW